MKLRIQGNSLRLRLTRKEVAEVSGCGRVESRIEFAPGCALNYALEGSSGAAAVTSTYDGRAILVKVPLSMMRRWAESDQVSMEGASESNVHLLIEKDFQCLHKPDQIDLEAYPHPLAT